jgi:hypothetical protein
LKNLSESLLLVQFRLRLHLTDHAGPAPKCRAEISAAAAQDSMLFSHFGSQAAEKTGSAGALSIKKNATILFYRL